MARTRSGEGRGVLRAMALLVAVGLAAAAAAVLVTGEDPQTLRLAVVGALWAFLLAALAAPRRRGEPPDDEGSAGKELELRRTYEIELEREVAARREYELQLEVYLRRELERGLHEEVQAVREELQRLRGEVIERLDGELRMERIETTRLIGGSLRALQEEARRLGLGLQVPGRLVEHDGVLGPEPPDRPELLGAGTPSGHPTDVVAAADPLAPGPTGLPPSSAAGSAGSMLEGLSAEAPSGLPAAAVPAAYSPYRPFQGLADPAVAVAGLPTEPGVPAAPPAPRAPQEGETVPSRRRRSRDEGEANEVLSRLLGR
jgi:hypothetical protein